MINSDYAQYKALGEHEHKLYLINHGLQQGKTIEQIKEEIFKPVIVETKEEGNSEHLGCTPNK